MTNEEAIEVLNKINPFNDNSKMQEYFESVEIAINSIQENTKLKDEIEQLKLELEQSARLPLDLSRGTVCYVYANSIYTVSVDNIGKVVKLRGVRQFYGCYEEAEQSLKGQV